MHLGAGLSVGFTGLAAGYAIGIIGDAVCSTFYQTQLRSTNDFRRAFAHICNNPAFTSE